MKVLIACEFSGIVREAFRKKGHDVWSCDLEETEINTVGRAHHMTGDVMHVLHFDWDMMIAFPPCTYLARSGARWWPQRKQEQKDALEFVENLMSADIQKIAIENPPGAIGTNIRKADQYIQPWEHGHTEKKMTGLWLKNLPKLEPTNNVKAEMEKLPKKLQNRGHYERPGPDRWKNRSRTFQGIADAMADQWG